MLERFLNKWQWKTVPAHAAAQHLNGQAAVAMTDAPYQEALSVAESGNLVWLLLYVT